MLWLYLIALAVLGAVIVLLLGRWDGAQPPREEGAGADDVDELLGRVGRESITAEDLDALSLDSAPRGYRMDQVDRLLDALSVQLRREATGQHRERVQDENAGEGRDQAFDPPSG